MTTEITISLISLAIVIYQALAAMVLHKNYNALKAMFEATTEREQLVSASAIEFIKLDAVKREDYELAKKCQDILDAVYQEGKEFKISVTTKNKTP